MNGGWIRNGSATLGNGSRINLANTITIQDFYHEVAALAAKSGITLPVNTRVKKAVHKPKHDGDLADLHQRVDLQYRRNNGQFFTPPDVAEFMVRYGIEGGTKTMLDPACGLGIFIDKMLDLHEKRCRIYGIDKDPSMVNACYLDIKTRHKAKSGRVKLHNADYLESEDSEKVDFLVCNPPYINFHGFDRNLILKIKEDFGVNFSMLTNIYALFMVKAKSSVKDGGRIAFITPSEFFYTGYGKTLKKFLLENFTIDSFVTFDFDSTIFDALTTATVTLMVNKKPKTNHHTKFIRTSRGLDGIMKMSHRGTKHGVYVNRVAQTSIDPDIKWQSYFTESTIPGLIMDSFVPLSRVAGVKRGIATGSNDFFTLSEEEKTQWNIEGRFLVPVVSKAAQIMGYEVTKDDMIELGKNGYKTHLLYCFETPSRNLSKYIRHGENEGVHRGYLCSHRSPWYSMERRRAAPILSTVFSRDNMRFILNKAECLNLASYHGIYTHFDDVGLTEALLCYLNSDLCMDIQKQARREYGNGLHKFEPSDLLDLPTMPIDKIGRKDALKMASLFRRLVGTKSNTENVKEKIDDTVREIALSLPPDQRKH